MSNYKKTQRHQLPGGGVWVNPWVGRPCLTPVLIIYTQCTSGRSNRGLQLRCHGHVCTVCAGQQQKASGGFLLVSSLPLTANDWTELQDKMGMTECCWLHRLLLHFNFHILYFAVYLFCLFYLFIFFAFWNLKHDICPFSDHVFHCSSDKTTRCVSIKPTDLTPVDDICISIIYETEGKIKSAQSKLWRPVPGSLLPPTHIK